MAVDPTDLSGLSLEQLADVRVLVQMDDQVANRKFRELMIDFAEGAEDFKLVALQVASAFDLPIAVGAQLDAIGAVVGLAREGFTDARYRTFLEIQILLLLSAARNDANWTGTIQNIVTVCRTFIGETALPVRLTNSPPYSYQVDVPGLVLSEANLLARFLKTANYAGVDGQLVVILAADSLYDSSAVAVTGAGIYCSASVVVAGCATYNTVIQTGC